LAGEGGLVGVAALGTYLSAAIVLDFVYRIFPLDAMSRMANGYYVLYSRDPHLAAIGFVWSPLQSATEIPLLALRPLFPALTTHNLAGSLVSVLAGMGAVHQLHAAQREWGVRRAPRLVVTALFALNPMVVYYAANGMSDMLLVFLLVGGARYLMRWLQDANVRDLVYAATFVGMAYLDRYEAVGAALVSTVVVMAVTFQRTTGATKTRVMSMLTDAVIFALPLVMTVAAWATMSYVITRQWLPANVNCIGTSACSSVSSTSLRLTDDLRNLWYLAPALGLVAVVAVVVALRRRDRRMMGPLAVIGGSLAFNAVGVVLGTIVPNYRYFLLAVPLEALLVGGILAFDRPVAADSGAPPPAVPPRRPLAHVLAVGTASAIGALVVLGPSMPSSALGMFAPRIAHSESQELGGIFLSHPNRVQLGTLHRFPYIQAIDRSLTAMHFSRGDVVVDTGGICIGEIVTSMPDPAIFVINNDRDYQRLATDPLAFGAHYMLVPDPTQVAGAFPAYPTMFATGGGFTKLAHEYPSDGTCERLRLYHVTSHPAA
jgi:hypothetical protein